MDIMHVDDEGMRRAASNMQQAAEQMTRAANLIDETLFRFLERFSEEVSRLVDPPKEEER